MQRTVVDNRYGLVERLGSGGMAEVYLAHDDVLGRDVALKVMSPRRAGEGFVDEESVERFEREARSAAALSHPNIVPVYDRGETEDGTCYIAMEHVPGGTLRGRISGSGAFEPRVAAEVARQIAGALEEAHERGVIHRDIKPENVLVTKLGDVKVADFGIARAFPASGVSGDDRVLGTASYMSPEQATGGAVDHRSDLYSLGVVLYEMLTGEPPHRAENPVATTAKHVSQPPRPPSKVDPGIPEDLDALVVRLLAKRAEDRPASATELVRDLERILVGPPPVAAGRRVRRVSRELAKRRPADGAPADGASAHSPGLAAVLSFCVSGLGQVYNGQILKGLVVMAVQAINVALTGILIGWVPLAVVWVWAIWDAHRKAEKMNAGGHRSRRKMLPWVVAAVSAALALFAAGWNPL